MLENKLVSSQITTIPGVWVGGRVVIGELDNKANSVQLQIAYWNWFWEKYVLTMASYTCDRHHTTGFYS